MSKREDPNQPLKFYSKIHRKCIHMVLHCAFIGMDQPEKRACSLFGGRNSNWETTCSWICNYKDVQHCKISCKKIILKLKKGTNNNKCKKCCDWDVERAKCSKKISKKCWWMRKKPRKLSLKLQQKESRKNMSRCSSR